MTFSPLSPKWSLAALQEQLYLTSQLELMVSEHRLRERD